MARTMATITERRAAAELRRRQAGEVGERGGDDAFRLYRSAVPGLGPARHGAPTTREIRAVTERRGDKDLVHTSGYFTRYERGYPMWDSFGEYEEIVSRGSGRNSLASKPEVAFLTNHGGMAMARTTTGTLELREDEIGGWHDGWLNPKRSDVSNLVIAINDGDVPQMSYAFMIPDGAGMWSEDFLQFRIERYDIDGGDVSAVNFGANPYTDISAQTPDVLDALDRIPAGALREAGARLAARSGGSRERIEVGRIPQVDQKASRAVRALQGRHARTAARYLELAKRNGLSVADLAGTQLPWYEIRAAAPAEVEEGTGPVEPESTDVFIYDEIGGSMGVSAKRFAADLAEITTPTIRIRINSPGGSVFDGEAIHSAILHHSSRTVGYADGLAASAASLIFMACDERVVMPAGELMVHDASMTTEGNAADHGKGETFLNRHSDHLADIYAERMGVTREEARQVMLDETWAFADEAVEMGLADRAGTRAEMLPTEDPAAERMARAHDLTRFAYRHQGRASAGAPRVTRGTAPLVDRDALRTAVEAQTNGSTPPVATGRSIALIEARLDMD